MAIIGKIQEKSRILVIGFVGLALLAFILSDLPKWLGSNQGQTNIGTIGGEEVDPKLFDDNRQLMLLNTQRQAQQQNQPVTEEQVAQAEESAWSITVDDIILSKEYEVLGIDVSDAEFNAYLYGEQGFTLLPDIQQSCADSITGQFDPKKLDKIIDDRENAKDAQQLAEWETTKKSIRKQRQQEKYFQLLAQGAYVTKLEAKAEYTAQKEVKSVSFVARNFRDIPDDKIKVSDADVKAFYEAHKSEKKYEVLAGRDIKYFDVTVQPSRRDSSDFQKVMNQLKTDFGKAKSDSLFVLANSDVKFYSSTHQATFRPQGDAKAREGLTFPPFMDTVFKMATIGQIVGPYDDAGKTRIAKVIDFNTKICKVRHILLSAAKGDDKKIATVKKLADSLVKIVNKDNFEAFVKQYSEDPGSKDKGGVYEDFMDYEMVAPFADFSAGKPVGTIGIVQTDFGFHIIEVLDRKEVKYPVLALIEKTLVASEETESTLKDKAYNLLFKLDAKLAKKEDVMDKLNLFDTLAKEEGFISRPMRMLDENPKITGFNTRLAEQKMLSLAYDEEAEIGRLCASPIEDKNRFIIAMVSSIREKGIPSYEDSYTQMRMGAMNEKKTKKILAQIGKTRNLKKLAKKFNTQVTTAEVTFANPSIQGGGYEPKVLGALFSGLKDGQTTVPLEGDQGVYVFKVLKTTKAPAAANYNAERTQMLAQARGSIQNEVRSALQKKATVMDNRKLQQVGIAR